MEGKDPLTATSDPGQKKLPAFKPWYIAVSQIYKKKKFKVSEENN